MDKVEIKIESFTNKNDMLHSSDNSKSLQLIYPYIGLQIKNKLFEIDVNNLPEYPHMEQGVGVKKAIEFCFKKNKGKLSNKELDKAFEGLETDVEYYKERYKLTDLLGCYWCEVSNNLKYFNKKLSDIKEERLHLEVVYPRNIILSHW